MSDEPDDVAGEGTEDDRSDEEVVDDFVEQRDLDELSWIEDGEKYRCPECEAVHDEPAEGCRVCGWEPEASATARD